MMVKVVAIALKYLPGRVTMGRWRGSECRQEDDSLARQTPISSYRDGEVAFGRPRGENGCVQL